jgi:hypothetical protein
VTGVHAPPWPGGASPSAQGVVAVVMAQAPTARPGSAG